MPRKSSSPQPRAPRPVRSSRHGSIELAPLLGLLALFVTLFTFVGNCFHSDLQEARRTASAAEVKAATLEVELRNEKLQFETYRRQIEAWSAREFSQTCDALKGRFNTNLKTCDLADGRFYRYEIPAP